MSFHPCGMVMDMIRTAYRTKMRTTQGKPPVDVVWFRAKEGAELYREETAFRSRVWDPERREWSGLGEQSELCCGRRSLKWYNGKPPSDMPGDHPCGSAEVARRGGIPGVDPEFGTNELGQAPCCGGDFIIVDACMCVGTSDEPIIVDACMCVVAGDDEPVIADACMCVGAGDGEPVIADACMCVGTGDGDGPPTSPQPNP